MIPQIPGWWSSCNYYDDSDRFHIHTPMSAGFPFVLRCRERGTIIGSYRTLGDAVSAAATILENERRYDPIFLGA